MHFPIHIHGITLFPKARYVDDCWHGLIDVVTGTGQVTIYRCVGGHPAEAIALAFVRVEMRALARTLGETSSPLR
jgi:hypothetical protein